MSFKTGMETLFSIPCSELEGLYLDVEDLLVRFFEDQVFASYPQNSCIKVKVLQLSSDLENRPRYPLNHYIIDRRFGRCEGYLVQFLLDYQEESCELLLSVNIMGFSHDADGVFHLPYGECDSIGYAGLLDCLVSVKVGSDLPYRY
jgi:hypothetical protein